MSKNIVDAIIEISEEIPIGLIPSRRQVDYQGGYVNNWNTTDFSEYVRSRTKKVLLVRDHCGPNQGQVNDNGLRSFYEDCRNMDVIHVDVWEKYKDYKLGLEETVNFITTGYSLNPKIYYEVGTEESIRPTTPHELDKYLTDLKKLLPEKIFIKIKYAVIQSGTALEGNKNTGTYDQTRLKRMVDVVRRHGLISKEHNGDYLPNELIVEKFKGGLDAINIAPEFGQIETKTILRVMEKHHPEMVNDFYKICYKSKKWIKWVDKDFKPKKNKKELINICGHYIFSNPKFKELIENKIDMKKLNRKIKIKIRNRILELNEVCQK